MTHVSGFQRGSGGGGRGQRPRARSRRVGAGPVRGPVRLPDHGRPQPALHGVSAPAPCAAERGAGARIQGVCQTPVMTSEPVTASAAGTWKLGDLAVNRVGLGAMRLTGSLPFGAGTPGHRDRAVSVLRRAAELGVNHIDTAAFYFSALRSANELINTALAPYPDDLVIVTKVGRDHLDVVNLRRMPSMESIAEHFGALAGLRDAGLIRHLGISGVTAGHLAEAQAIAPVVCVQNRYGIDLRGDDGDDVLRACGEQGIAFVPFFAIAGESRHAGASGTDSDELLAVARAHGATPAQVRLAWTLHRGPHVLAIPGTGDPDHLTSNIAAGALRLTPDDMARLDGLHQAAG